ncbi:MAG: MBL fold metallo-hydrolase [Patescibacteria group bacterium]|nr:MBL fold metallo-hydrolase [Patescibacteria group bacterium]
MIINWYGEGCFKIQTGGLTLVTDPFESATGLTPPRGKNEITLKTLTAWPMKDEDGEGQVIRGAGEYEVQSIGISGFELPAESTDKFFKTAYQVTAEDMTLGFLGHLSEGLTPDASEKLKDTDILFIPAGGKPFINPEAAAKLIKQLSPKLVVASFFKVPGLKRGGADWKALGEELDQKPEVMEKLTIRKKEVGEKKGTTLVVLKI